MLASLRRRRAAEPAASLAPAMRDGQLLAALPEPGAGRSTATASCVFVNQAAEQFLRRERRRARAASASPSSSCRTARSSA